MTNKEAIKEIKNRLQRTFCDHCVAVKYIGNCTKCEQEKATEIFRNLCEKQAPQDPIEITVENDSGQDAVHKICPACQKREVKPTDFYCSRCGQAIDWRKGAEKEKDNDK